MNQNIFTNFFSVLKPAPKLTISQWADQYRYLSQENCAEPGKWTTDRAEYQREMMDAFCDPRVFQVVAMTSAQIGKSEILNNVLGYYIHQDPSPSLVVLPTEAIAKDYSKTRISPMIRDTPVLEKIFGATKTRYTGNTILTKEYPGGRVVLVGANAPSGLASRPIRILLLDEVGRYATTKEGDPVVLAKKRTQTFYNRKIGEWSTPGIQGNCRIERDYNQSDKRKFFVPCPHCKHKQILKWSNVKWKKGKDGFPIRESVKYQCENCRKLINHNQKSIMVSKGEWRATEEFKGIAGFWINELYSPWSTWYEMAIDWYNAKKNKELLREFINLRLGETWAEEGIEIDYEDIMGWREDYGDCDIPAGGLVLVGAVDVQNDRVEGEIVAYGKGQESWGIDYFVIQGNPALPETWNDLEMQLKKTYKHESGTIMNTSCVVVDSGDGNYTNEVYRFTKKYEILRWFSVKGSSIIGKPIVPAKPSIAGRWKNKLFMVGTDTAKQLLYNRLMFERVKTDSGPGFMHFPKKYPDEYFKQLTAEKAIFKKDNAGFTYRKWKKIRSRNEALDIRVYSLAAIGILNPNYDLLAKRGPVKGINYNTKRVIRKRNPGIR